jgi:hypothetical protein
VRRCGLTAFVDSQTGTSNGMPVSPLANTTHSLGRKRARFSAQSRALPLVKCYHAKCEQQMLKFAEWYLRAGCYPALGVRVPIGLRPGFRFQVEFLGCWFEVSVFGCWGFGFSLSVPSNVTFPLKPRRLGETQFLE